MWLSDASSVSEKKEDRSETALVVFTLLEPSALGVAFSGLLLGGFASLLCVSSALFLATFGMVASIFHLAKPIRAPFSLHSCLCRRIALS